MIGNPTALAAKLEGAFGRRSLESGGAPFQYRDRTFVPTVSSGIFEIDALTGGLPRGALTEIYGSACSGRTSLLLAALAARTAQGEVCGLVDGRDAFDPASAKNAGVRLEQVLWVRCGAPQRTQPRRAPGAPPVSVQRMSESSGRYAPEVSALNQALRAADLLIQAKGFGFIALDLSDIPPKMVRQVPLNLWFRFRRAVEDTPTVLMVLEQDANAKTCASLVLRCAAESARWKRMEADAQGFPCHKGPCLLGGVNAMVEVVRSRAKPVAEFRTPDGGAPPRQGMGRLETKTAWEIADWTETTMDKTKRDSSLRSE